MKLGHRSFATRLSLVLAVLLLAYGLLVGAWAQHAFKAHEQEALQRISHGLARHIVENWPAITSTDPEQAAREEREKLLSMLKVVNPGVQAYVLDIQGRVQAYIGEPGMVREHQVDLDKVRAFLADAPLPLLGTDPMGSGKPRVFSAAMFPPRSADPRPPGYLYIVLDGAVRDEVALSWGHRLVWQGGAAVVGVGLALTLLVGVFTFRRLTMPLHRLAQRLQSYGPLEDAANAPQPAVPAIHDEVQAIAQAFQNMDQRLQAHTAREQRQERDHREAMAGLAHDLRTPLTALHGHLEGLLGFAGHEAARRDSMLQAALAQSDKVRRLSQQLFELAALQSSNEVTHQERFSLDELITDTVRKFEVGQASPPVVLCGAEPGALAVKGDLQLVERALTNLIDNAIRHAEGHTPVRVSVSRQEGQAHILIEDLGPGLPQDVSQRLALAQSLRDPPLKRISGGIGGLGLAIAQRVAMLHGGSLKPVNHSGPGACLCLALPLVD
jgi:signal transduction histidine kinase